MIDSLSLSVKGHVTIKDKNTGEVMLDKPNAVHFGNISTKLAEAFIGKPSSFLTYMAFGNGGVTIDGSGIITYNEPNVSSTKVPTAQLYNTVYIREFENYNTDGQSDLTRDANTGGGENNYEDITVVIELGNNEPDLQLDTDNGNVISDNDDPLANTDFVFNEIALYTGEKGLGNRQSGAEINDFLTTDTSSDRPTMVTHITFHPIQKSKNRVLEITYKLRIQMGT